MKLDYQELAKSVAHLATELSTAINLHVADDQPVMLALGNRAEATAALHQLLAINRLLHEAGERSEDAELNALADDRRNSPEVQTSLDAL